MNGTIWRKSTFNLAPIKRVMKDREISPTQVAADAGLSRNQVHLILKGEPTKEETLCKVLRVLGLTLDEVTS